MKTKSTALLILAGLFGWCSLLLAQEPEVSVTVYNQDLALIRDVRTFELKAGEQRLYFQDVAAQIDPTSVHLRSLTAPNSLLLLEQNFEYDLVDADKILKKYIDHEIELCLGQKDTLRGTLLNSGDQLVVALPSGEVRLIQNKDIRWLNFPRLPEGLITRPTLVWLVKIDKSQKHRLETEYLTRGIDWHAEYVALLNDRETEMDLTAWVSVDNRSGIGYKNARLKLVAGEVHLAEERVAPRYEIAKAMQAMAEQPVSEKEFFEYHLYTVNRLTSINNNQVKQLTLFDAAGVTLQKKYLFDGQRWPKQVRLYTRFKNEAKNHLGMPFPAGKFRVYKKDVDSSMVFLGEDRIEHTPKDEWLETFLGAAFDIKAERKQISSEMIGKNQLRESYEIALRNHKKAAVTVTVVENFTYRMPESKWKIIEYSLAYTQKDARTAEFSVAVPTDQEVKLRYTVDYSW